MPEPLRVVMADDDPMIRVVVGRVLATDPRFCLVASGADGEQAVDAVAEHDPDVVLLDVSMPRMDGVQAVATIRARSATIGIVMCSSEAGRRIDALRAGANEWVDKPPDAARLTAALLAARPGQGEPHVVE